MTERTSRIAVAFEALLFALPVTLLGTLAFASVLFSLASRSDQIYERAQNIVYTLPVLPLLAGWTLVARFVIFGSDSLRSSSRLLWLLALSGVALVCAALLFRVRANFGDARSLWAWVRSYLGELIFGAPAIVPLIHLIFERRLRMPSNQSLERP